MKEELAGVLEQRVGLDRQKAEQAAEVALDFIKDRAPEPVRQYLEGGGLSKGLGSLFGP
jgi:hypothetical protein